MYFEWLSGKYVFWICADSFRQLSWPLQCHPVAFTVKFHVMHNLCFSYAYCSSHHKKKNDFFHQLSLVATIRTLVIITVGLEIEVITQQYMFRLCLFWWCLKAWCIQRPAAPQDAMACGMKFNLLLTWWTDPAVTHNSVLWEHAGPTGQTSRSRHQPWWSLHGLPPWCEEHTPNKSNK